MNYISFPKLNLYFEIERTAFTIFGIPVYWYGVIIAVGLVIALLTILKLGKRIGINQDNILDMVIFGLPTAVICARLYYVIFEFDSYKNDLIQIFNIRNGGLAIYGGVIGGVLSTFIYCRIKKLNMLKMFDIGAVGLIIGQMIGRWGNFFNQEAFGGNTDLPWGMTGSQIVSDLRIMKEQGLNVDPSANVHPTFLYESLWSLLVLAVLLVILYRLYKFYGQIFFSYIALYGLGRFFIEALRTDSLYIGVFRVSQIVAILCVITGIISYIYLYKRQMKILKIKENE